MKIKKKKSKTEDKFNLKTEQKENAEKNLKKVTNSDEGLIVRSSKYIGNCVIYNII